MSKREELMTKKVKYFYDDFEEMFARSDPEAKKLGLWVKTRDRKEWWISSQTNLYYDVLSNAKEITKEDYQKMAQVK